jgi:hypothetical protein
MAPSSDPGFQQIFQIWARISGTNGITGALCLHPQHMKVVIDLEYVWEGCENHLMRVWRQYQCTRASYMAPSSDPGLQPISQIWAHMCGGNDRMVALCLHPQHMKGVIDLAYV